MNLWQKDQIFTADAINPLFDLANQGSSSGGHADSNNNHSGGESLLDGVGGSGDRSDLTNSSSSNFLNSAFASAFADSFDSNIFTTDKSSEQMKRQFYEAVHNLPPDQLRYLLKNIQGQGEYEEEASSNQSTPTEAEPSYSNLRANHNKNAKEDDHKELLRKLFATLGGSGSFAASMVNDSYPYGNSQSSLTDTTNHSMRAGNGHHSGGDETISDIFKFIQESKAANLMAMDAAAAAQGAPTGPFGQFQSPIPPCSVAIPGKTRTLSPSSSSRQRSPSPRRLSPGAVGLSRSSRRSRSRSPRDRDGRRRESESDRYRSSHRSRSRERDREARYHERSSRYRDDHDDRYRERDRESSRKNGQRDAKSVEKEEEISREEARLKLGFPKIRKNCMTICSTTIWIGHMYKYTGESDISDVFGEFGVIDAVDVSIPFGWVC